MNNPDEIRRLVEQARQEAAQDQGQPGGAADPQAAAERSQSAAAELMERLPGRLLAICLQSSDAMQWRSEEMSGSGTEFQLRWVDPPPERTLSIVIESSGVVLWGWFADRVRPAYNRWNAPGFSDSFLSSLVEALGDQAAWSEGRLPEVRFGHSGA